MQKTVWKLIRITMENLDLYVGCMTAPCVEKIAWKNTVAMGVHSDDGQEAGALVALIQDNGMEILSIYVKPEHRLKGAGAFLLKNLKALLAKSGKEHLSVEYSYPRMRELEQFFIKQGFKLESVGNVIYTFPVEKLSMAEFLKQKAPAVNGSILPASNMSVLQRRQWTQRFGKDLPSELDPAQMGGTYLPEDTMVYMNHDRVEAYAACSMLDDETVYLGAVYSSPASAKALLLLLQKTLNQVADKYKEKAMCIAGATESGKKLMERLSRGYEEMIDIQTVRTLVWNKTEEETMAIDVSVLDVLMPRLNGLSENLREIGIENDVIISAQVYPAIMAETEMGIIRLSYLMAGPLEKERFLLSITAETKQPEGQEESLFMLCEEYNRTSFFASAIYDIAGTAILRATVPEAYGIFSGEALRFVLELFKDAQQRWEAMANAPE